MPQSWNPLYTSHRHPKQPQNCKMAQVDGMASPARSAVFEFRLGFSTRESVWIGLAGYPGVRAPLGRILAVALARLRKRRRRTQLNSSRKSVDNPEARGDSLERRATRRSQGGVFSRLADGG